MSASGHRFWILFSVTLTGMAVLIVEITATRMLAPFFGNSIFTISSVIGIVLAALGVGYYVGGRLADRRPSEAWFFSLIACSGFAVLLLQLLNARLLPALAYQLSIIHGPLVVSLLMFFFPAMVLAMLSPFAITLLHARAKGGVGNASGLVFFWSTLGSIAGSLSTGFLLIPNWGISTILVGVGAGLVLLGGAGLALTRKLAPAVPAGVMLLGVACGLLLRPASGPEPISLVYAADGLYDRIVIRDMQHQGRAVRILWQDQNMNGGMFLDDGSLAFDYTKYFELYRLFTPALKRALVVGGGSYGIPGAILRDAPATLVDVAEIDPTLHGLAVKYFELPEDPRLRNHVMDGRRFLHDAPGAYDLIFTDAYRSFVSVPPQFTTREFFELALDRLADQGVLITNYYGSLAPDSRAIVYSVLRTLRAVFPQVYVFATTSPRSEALQNFIFVGYKTRPGAPRVELGRAASLEFAYPMLREVAAREWTPDPKLIDAYPLLTDDYAPVEYYAVGAIRRYDAIARRPH